MKALVMSAFLFLFSCSKKSDPHSFNHSDYIHRQMLDQNQRRIQDNLHQSVPSNFSPPVISQPVFQPAVIPRTIPAPNIGDYR
jgi:hypothetical protein